MKNVSVFASVFLTLICSASAQDLPAKYKTAGKVAVANQPIYPPMEYKDPSTGTRMGLDIDLMQALTKELGTTVEWTDISFEQMIPSLLTGRADAIIAALVDTPKRRESVDFVDYMKSGAQFYTSATRGDQFRAVTDFCGKSIAMGRATAFPTEASEWSAKNCEATGKSALVVIGTESSADARLQLKQGRVDGAMVDSVVLPYLLKLEPNTYLIVGDPISEKQLGIAFDKKSADLRDAFSKALERIIATGEYKQILAKYGLERLAIDGSYINGNKVK